MRNNVQVYGTDLRHREREFGGGKAVPITSITTNSIPLTDMYYTH